jgi:hypothetical protein
MTPEEQDEALWRDRFIMINVVRLGGTAVVLFALVLWQTDRIVAGGSILGLPLALAGLVMSFFGPKYLAAQWRTPPRP